MGPSVATPTIPQNAAASGERTFQANMFNPALLGGRGAGGGRRGHGLSRSLRVSETMLSILTLSVTPACLRLSVRARFTLSARRRSEEHTSELQSRLHLVCRLLLEKKKRSLKPWRI